MEAYETKMEAFRAETSATELEFRQVWAISAHFDATLTQF